METTSSKMARSARRASSAHVRRPTSARARQALGFKNRAIQVTAASEQKQKLSPLLLKARARERDGERGPQSGHSGGTVAALVNMAEPAWGSNCQPTTLPLTHPGKSSLPLCCGRTIGISEAFVVGQTLVKAADCDLLNKQQGSSRVSSHKPARRPSRATCPPKRAAAAASLWIRLIGWPSQQVAPGVGLLFHSASFLSQPGGWWPEFGG